ncbi:MAG: polysaccharide deacetylase family protein, partial [Herminiimonas sp.]|nr:polysaccharide deacetylase family protein [Herminiimonas sp.]
MKEMPVVIRRIVFWLVLCVSPLFAVAASSEKPVYLYRSTLTSQFIKPGDVTQEDTLAVWRNYLRKFRKDFHIVDRAQLLARLTPGVLVLPSTHALDDAERAAIRDFAAAGGSLLATGATGSLDATGKFIGYDFLDTYFKVRVRGDYKAGSEWFMMPFGDGPLTWSLPAGRRIYVGDDLRGILRIESDNLAAVLMNWMRAKDDAGPNGAIALHESATNRSVFFAFPEAALGYHAPAEVSQLLDSVMAWLRREPKLFKAAWPEGFVAAHLMEMDTEDKFFSAPNFADHLEKIGVKGTFYCLTSEAIKYPAIVKDLLARGHEIAYHADIHFGFKGEDPAIQDKRMRNMKKQMQTILGNSLNLATGFRAPTEAYDAITEGLLRKHGILHHAADPSSHEDRLPFFSSAEPGLGPEEALVVLPRTQFDDVNFKRFGYGVAQVQETLDYDLDLVVKGGAFGLLSVHTQNYVDGGLMKDSMGKYVEKVATYKDRLWIARGDQIASWWRKRHRV